LNDLFKYLLKINWSGKRSWNEFRLDWMNNWFCKKSCIWIFEITSKFYYHRIFQNVRYVIVVLRNLVLLNINELVNHLPMVIIMIVNYIDGKILIIISIQNIINFNLQKFIGKKNINNYKILSKDNIIQQIVPCKKS
jgi:hypothetical protein